jgi:demethylmenaquinone methyltransferase/2-methoxy-6-polyprenyl-1,4-benzoquinol methylase
MGSRYFIEGGGRADGVRDLFAVVAPRYDLVNDLQSFGLHRWWKRRLVQWAGVRPGDAVLDVCCGTGDIALALARQGGRVTGLDFSEPMLTVARRRQNEHVMRGGRRLDVVFEQGDALALRWPEAQFDVVTISYGLRNLQSIDGGLAEIWRVLRPGGRLVILDFGTPPNRVWRALYFAHLRWVVPVLGRWFCGECDTHAYILESLRRYPDAPVIGERMEAAGLTGVRWGRLLGGIMTLHRGEKGRS